MWKFAFCFVILLIDRRKLSNRVWRRVFRCAAHTHKIFSKRWLSHRGGYDNLAARTHVCFSSFLQTHNKKEALIAGNEPTSVTKRTIHLKSTLKFMHHEHIISFADAALLKEHYLKRYIRNMRSFIHFQSCIIAIFDNVNFG
jgi:hypothetical protein